MRKSSGPAAKGMATVHIIVNTAHAIADMVGKVADVVGKGTVSSWSTRTGSCRKHWRHLLLPAKTAESKEFA